MGFVSFILHDFQLHVASSCAQLHESGVKYILLCRLANFAACAGAHARWIVRINYRSIATRFLRLLNEEERGLFPDVATNAAMCCVTSNLRLLTAGWLIFSCASVRWFLSLLRAMVGVSRRKCSTGTPIDR